jgi:hypothetical protein
VGALFLIGATVVLYHMTNWLYMIEAVNLDAKVVFTISELMPLLDFIMWIDIYLAFAWSATFIIKFSFLSFFHTLIRNVSVRLTRYFWSVVIFTGLTWAFLIAEPFILCPYFGAEASKRTQNSRFIILDADSTVKCYPNTPYGLNVGLMSLVTVLDVIIDAMSQFDARFLYSTCSQY